MNLGYNFAEKLSEVLHFDRHRIVKVDLKKNLISDDGISLIMPEIRRSKSIIELNLASNEISNEGMVVIFQNLADNQSVISLTLST